MRALYASPKLVSMTLFQAIIASIIGVFSEIYPIAPGAHQGLLEYFLGWNVSHPRLQGAIELGIFISLLFTLRHDLLAQVSSLIQVILFRKKPKAMDERMPIFVLIALVPSVASFLFFRQSPILPSESPFLFAAVFGLSGLPMAFFDYYTKKNKSIYDWNALDSVFIGLGSAALIIPEVGRTAGAFTLSALRNFKREGAAKFILFVATPLLGLSAWYHLRGPGSTIALSDFPQTYYYVSLAVSVLTSSFLIHVFLGQIQKTPLLRYAVYRVLIAIGVLALHFYRASG